MRGSIRLGRWTADPDRGRGQSRRQSPLPRRTLPPFCTGTPWSCLSAVIRQAGWISDQRVRPRKVEVSWTHGPMMVTCWLFLGMRGSVKCPRSAQLSGRTVQCCGMTSMTSRGAVSEPWSTGMSTTGCPASGTSSHPVPTAAGRYGCRRHPRRPGCTPRCRARECTDCAREGGSAYRPLPADLPRCDTRGSAARRAWSSSSSAELYFGGARGREVYEVGSDSAGDWVAPTQPASIVRTDMKAQASGRRRRRRRIRWHVPTISSRRRTTVKQGAMPPTIGHRLDTPGQGGLIRSIVISLYAPPAAESGTAAARKIGSAAATTSALCNELSLAVGQQWFQ